VKGHPGNNKVLSVFLQLCGWLGVEELWVGAVSDSHYMRFISILKRQQIFAKEDAVNGEYMPFSNILDKGYCINRNASNPPLQVVIGSSL
jgi:hypothetical protein